jgi:hypothetical protein
LELKAKTREKAETEIGHLTLEFEILYPPVARSILGIE